MEKDRFTYDSPDFIESVSRETNRLLARASVSPVHDDDVCFAERPGPPPHIEVASNTEAMKMALQEYLVLLMFERGEDDWKPDYYRLCWAAEEAALKEYRSSKIVKEAQTP